MANIVKRGARNLKHRVVGGVHYDLKQLDEKVSHVSIKLGETHHAIEETQLKINHHQMELLQEVYQRQKNSGNIVLSESEMVAKIFSGLKMYLDPRDIAVVPHLVLDGIWEHRITAAWLEVVRSHDTVLDIGSNFGYFGAIAAQKTDKKYSKIIHFEANPHLIPYIRKTLAVNWLNEQSVIENLAVGERKGKLTLNLLKDYIGSSSVLPIEHSAEYMQDKMYLELAEAIKVDAVSIDEYCKQYDIKHVNLIKMDIEGFEDKAYAGMRQTVQASPAITLFVEFTKDSYEEPKAFYNQMLKDFGHVYVINDDGRITKPKQVTYESVIGDTDDWVMPIFSKNSKLAEQ